jgi:hypothetical protein
MDPLGKRCEGGRRLEEGRVQRTVRFGEERQRVEGGWEIKSGVRSYQGSTGFSRLREVMLEVGVGVGSHRGSAFDLKVDTFAQMGIKLPERDRERGRERQRDRERSRERQKVRRVGGLTCI